MARLLLNLRGIHVTFGGKPCLEGADLPLAEGERIALVGRNGSGKSTLLKIAADLIEADSGDRWVQPGTTIRYLPQEPDLSGFCTTSDYVAAGLGPGDDTRRVASLLRQLNLTGAEHPSHLSGGELRRAAIARALAPDPDILLLDEPTNHLDLPAIEWLEQELAACRSTIVLISHDRRFLENLSNRTVWLDRGAARRLERGFAEFETWRDRVLAEEELAQARLAQRIATEEHWMRHGVTARRKRNMRRVDLLGRLRTERRDDVGPVAMAKLHASGGDLSGRLVADARNVSKAFGQRCIAKGLNLLLMRGDRLALVGANGSGKTTLIRLLTGALTPDGGTIRLGTNVETIILEQGRDSLAPDDSLAHVITSGHGERVMIDGVARHVVSYMKDFLFRPDQARTPVSVLSGGERARLILAREFARPSNLLVLDEPTNDLDLETLDLLQELLADYRGTILLVSHDRDFIDRVATSVLMAEDGGRWTEYAGGYSDMLAQRGFGVEARKSTPAEPLVASRKRLAADEHARRKLSFKDKHALETLPGEIDRLQLEIKILEERLALPDYFAQGPRSFESSARRLLSVREQLSKAEDRWLELELLHEALDGS
ncbi:MAG: ATP-binding cassette domain-containing protein [Rhizobiales bacterium]|nr:ATP-binding cassette domain-containing protein [Hyphomicrobiales bacterium]